MLEYVFIMSHKNEKFTKSINRITILASVLSLLLDFQFVDATL
jgi:hypothetical protein